MVVFSPRELTIMRELLRDGASNDQIAGRLFLAEDTVKTHFRRIFDKTRVRNRTALVNAIWRKEIVMVDPLGRVIEP